jgi:superfamily II DNA/RNA helicase
MLEDQWEDKKVIVFAQFRGTCDALVKRQQKKGLTTALVWGTEMDSAKNAAYKDSQVKKFWRDPNCQVLIGTMAMTRSLNLQVSNIVVNLGSTMLNPATVKQLVGRSRRGGSKHSHIVVANVLCKGTQEEHYPEVLKRRQAIADYMAGEESELFEKLTPFEMLNFIRE